MGPIGDQYPADFLHGSTPSFGQEATQCVPREQRQYQTGILGRIAQAYRGFWGGASGQTRASIARDGHCIDYDIAKAVSTAPLDESGATKQSTIPYR